jgi:hypothetical protein
MKYQAICTDIDGTLLNADRELSARTIAAIKAMAGRVPIILASSRMPMAMRHLQQELEIDGLPLICYNGGYVIAPASIGESMEVIHTAEIPLAACETTLKLTAGNDVHVSLYHADDWFVPAMDYWAKREQNNTKVNPLVTAGAQVMDAWRERGIGAHKVMLMGPEEEIDQAVRALQADFGEVLHLYRSKATYLEIAHRSINKATALQMLLDRHYSFAIDGVVAFGDNYNDIDLLTASGHGVAVGNAREEVKAIANEVTATGKEDGVAMVLERLFG